MKPILFNTEMTKAILDGRKIVTRRIVKPQPIETLQYPYGFITGSTDKKEIGKFCWTVGEICNGRVHTVKPPYKVGDILYVRETFANTWTPDSNDIGFIYKTDGTPYRFPYWGNEKQCKNEVWIPSIHMPKEAARIFLKVTDVRVERMQEITNEEAKKEGITVVTDNSGLMHRTKFCSTFLKIYPECTLQSWVWVIEFERTVKPYEN